MTEITATLNGNHYKLEAKNHAGDSKVCTAISTLMCTLAGAVQNNPEAVCPYIDLDYGSSKVEFLAEGELAVEDFCVILLGLIQLEREYPGDIHISQNIFQ